MTDSAKVLNDHIGYLRKQIDLRDREIERRDREIELLRKKLGKAANLSVPRSVEPHNPEDGEA